MPYNLEFSQASPVFKKVGPNGRIPVHPLTFNKEIKRVKEVKVRAHRDNVHFGLRGIVTLQKCQDLANEAKYFQTRRDQSPAPKAPLKTLGNYASDLVQQCYKIDAGYDNASKKMSELRAKLESAAVQAPSAPTVSSLADTVVNLRILSEAEKVRFETFDSIIKGKYGAPSTEGQNEIASKLLEMTQKTIDLERQNATSSIKDAEIAELKWRSSKMEEGQEQAATVFDKLTTEMASLQGRYSNLKQSMMSGDAQALQTVQQQLAGIGEMMKGASTATSDEIKALQAKVVLADGNVEGWRQMRADLGIAKRESERLGEELANARETIANLRGDKRQPGVREKTELFSRLLAERNPNEARTRTHNIRPDAAKGKAKPKDHSKAPASSSKAKGKPSSRNGADSTRQSKAGIVNLTEDTDEEDGGTPATRKDQTSNKGRGKTPKSAAAVREKSKAMDGRPSREPPEEKKGSDQIDFTTTSHRHGTPGSLNTRRSKRKSSAQDADGGVLLDNGMDNKRARSELPGRDYTIRIDGVGLSPDELSDEVRRAIEEQMLEMDRVADRWHMGSTSALKTCCKTKISNMKDDFHHNKDFACQRCARLARFCIVIPEMGERPSIRPLHEDDRADKSSTYRELGFWIFVRE